MSWDRPFPQPVPLPHGPPAQTLRDAAGYIRKLPLPERDCQEWRLAVQMLIDAAMKAGRRDVVGEMIAPETATLAMAHAGSGDMSQTWDCRE